MYEILAKNKLNSTVDQMIIHAPFVAKNAKPGHFIIIRVDKDGERIPLTIVDHDETSITIIYQKLGYSTSLLGTLSVGDNIHDVVGPLGQPAEIKDISTLLAIAGGVGAAPMLPQLRAYFERGVNIDLILGARSKEYLILLDEYKEICRNIYLCTDDGSIGFKGFVTDKFDEMIQHNSYDHVVAIGPLIMMKLISERTKSIDLSTDVSLNPIMIDGTGMCGNCRVSIHGKTYFACIDGPDFDADGINFDELLSRQSYYKDQEHICNLELKRK
jgi:NAD(P)H-flavin reductase